MSELEGRWAAAYVIVALAIGAVLAREAYQARFRWWFLNVPVALLVGIAGSLGGSGVAHFGSRASPLVLGRRLSRGERLWVRLLGSFMGAGWTFDQLTSRLEGRAVWPGTYARWWTICWPLGALMLFVNATEVQAGGRLTAERRALTSDRTGLRNHYALDADLAQLATLQTPFTFVYFDLDGFKPVNDRIGHKAGDEVLAETGVFLSRLEAQGTIVAYHLHGDEFAFLVPGYDNAHVQELVHLVFADIRAIGVRRSTNLGATFGAARGDASATDPDAVRHTAEEQMRRAKVAGKRRLAFASGQVVVLAT